jgi:glycosyltransferase involved in cell wall biosynthesis
MLLDIIVPHYDEPAEVIRPFFNMIHSQRGVDFNDFRVTVVHNGEKSATWLKAVAEGPANIRFMYLPEKGVSRARNWGLDNAMAEWVCFCDCDDCFSSVFSLHRIFSILKSETAEKVDLFWSPFYISWPDGGLQTSSEMNYVFIHNKFYRRQFLIDHDIHFPEHLYMSEDSAFNQLVKLEIGPHRTASIDYPEPLYAWCRRQRSITTDLSRWLSNTEGHFDRNLFVLEEYRKRGATNTELLVARLITDVYSMLHRPGIEIHGDQRPLIKRVAKFYIENKEAYQSVPKKMVKKALAASDKDSGTAQYLGEINRPELDVWLQSIELIGEA